MNRVWLPAVPEKLLIAASSLLQGVRKGRQPLRGEIPSRVDVGGKRHDAVGPRRGPCHGPKRATENVAEKLTLPAVFFLFGVSSSRYPLAWHELVGDCHRLGEVVTLLQPRLIDR